MLIAEVDGSIRSLGGPGRSSDRRCGMYISIWSIDRDAGATVPFDFGTTNGFRCYTYTMQSSNIARRTTEANSAARGVLGEQIGFMRCVQPSLPLLVSKKKKRFAFATYMTTIKPAFECDYTRHRAMDVERKKSY